MSAFAGCTLLERLLEITKAARTAATIQAIDELQAEVDTIHGRT